MQWTFYPSSLTIDCLLIKLVKIVYLIPQTRGERMYYSVRVLYFDRLLMRNFSGTATCHAILPHDMPSTEEPPEVICGKSYVIVKLPSKKFKDVKVLGEYLSLVGYTIIFLPAAI